MVFVRLVIVALPIILSGCAQHHRILPEKFQHVYVAEGMKDTLLNRYVPVYLTYDYPSQSNRIGRVAAKYDAKGREQIYVDTERHSIYYLQREFSTEKGRYTNLIYRVDFPEIPFSLIPFNFTAGRNVGILVIITLNNQQRPVLVTTVGTCGGCETFVEKRIASWSY